MQCIRSFGLSDCVKLRLLLLRVLHVEHDYMLDGKVGHQPTFR